MDQTGYNSLTQEQAETLATTLNTLGIIPSTWYEGPVENLQLCAKYLGPDEDERPWGIMFQSEHARWVAAFWGVEGYWTVPGNAVGG